MQFADAMAFPFSQTSLMAKLDDLSVDPLITLYACHVTTVPPYVTDMETVRSEHAWFTSKLVSLEGKMLPAFFYGLQCPPENLTESDLLALKDMGIRFMTLAYTMPTEYGGGFATPEEPLTDRGRWLIEMMADVGIVLDLSHAGHQTARDAIKFTRASVPKARVVVTHTGSYEMYPHPRNLPDDVLKLVVDSGGFVGLLSVTWLLSKEDNSSAPFLAHLDHLLWTVGSDGLCLGTDSVYTLLNEEEERERFLQMSSKLDPDGTLFGARYPGQPEVMNGPVKLLRVQGLLTAHGVRSPVAEDIMGRNLMKYFDSLADWRMS